MRFFQQARLLTIAISLAGLTVAVQAKDKKTKTPPKDPQDEIEVVGHIPLTGGPVRHFMSTQHYSSYYLYAEHDAGTNVTLIDVTKASAPTLLSNVSYTSSGPSSLSVVTGTAALVADGGPSAPPAAPQTIRIFDFSDPQHPRVSREFTGVTAMTRDDRRGLIFLANGEGIWILHQNFATDPEVEKAYENYITYSH